MNKRRIGAKYEEMAAQYLHSCGLKIIEQNFRCKTGEVDLIALDGKYTVFIEVKYRTGTRSGAPEEAVDFRKQRTICRVCDFYRHTRHLSEDTPIRFDVLAILVDAADGEDLILDDTKIRWHKDAFTYIY